VQQHLANVNGPATDCASSPCVVAAASTSDIAGTLTVVPIRFGFPSPSSASACRHGGWRQLADGDGRPFTNQGRCVSWVASQRHR
jgi:hypothetical protein